MFILLNIGLAIAGVLSLLLDWRMPGFLAVPCGLIGGLLVLSRIAAWATGAAQHGWSLVEAGEQARRMLFIEVVTWIASIINIAVFVRFISQ